MANSSIPVLVIGFNRPKFLAALLENLKENRIRNVYVSLDGPRNRREESICAQSLNTVLSYSSDFNLVVLHRRRNLGCFLGVISALDWFFSQVDFGIILEDDCLPVPSFFTHINESLTSLSNSDLERKVIISGHNPFIQRQKIEFSGYPLIHGWATWSTTWHSLRNDYFKLTLPSLFNKNGERRKARQAIYWWANASRARLGGVDTWDSIFVERSWKLGYKCIIPKENLISNVGFGSIGTHTRDEDASNLVTNGAKYADMDIDSALSKGYFRIKLRHIFTPFLKVIIDYFQISNRKKFEDVLSEDLKSHSIIFL